MRKTVNAFLPFLLSSLFLTACPSRNDPADAAVDADRGVDATGVDSATPEDGGAIVVPPECAPLGDALAAFSSCRFRDVAEPLNAVGAECTDWRVPFLRATLATLDMGESDAMNALGQDVGFDGPLDLEDLLWGRDGTLTSWVEHDLASEVGDRLETRFPYPGLRDFYEERPRERLDLFRGALTGQQLVGRLWAMQADVEEISELYEVSADRLPAPSGTIEVGCGMGRWDFQKPDLYALASSWAAVAFVYQLTRAYDWDFQVREVIDVYDADDRLRWRAERGTDHASRVRRSAELLNAHLGHISDDSVLPEAENLLGRALDLATQARAAVSGATDTESTTLDYTASDTGFWSDIQLNIDAAQSARDEATAVPRLNPRFEGDLRALYESGGLDADDFERMFLVLEDEEWNEVWVEFDESVIDPVLRSFIDPSIFVDAESLEVVDHDWSYTEAADYAGGPEVEVYGDYVGSLFAPIARRFLRFGFLRGEATSWYQRCTDSCPDGLSCLEVGPGRQCTREYEFCDEVPFAFDRCGENNGFYGDVGWEVYSDCSARIDISVDPGTCLQPCDFDWQCGEGLTCTSAMWGETYRRGVCL